MQTKHNERSTWDIVIKDLNNENEDGMSFPFQIDDVRRREVGFGCKCFQDVLIIREKKEWSQHLWQQVGPLN